MKSGRPGSHFIYPKKSGRPGSNFRYPKKSRRPGADFIYTKKSGRPGADFIYTKNFSTKIMKINDIFEKFPRCARQFIKNFVTKIKHTFKKFPRCARQFMKNFLTKINWYIFRKPHFLNENRSLVNFHIGMSNQSSCCAGHLVKKS